VLYLKRPRAKSLGVERLCRGRFRYSDLKEAAPWDYGILHAFRRGLASNLYEMGAPDKVVQRVLRHSKPHVTKERYIKVFDRTVLEAVQKMQARIEELRQAKGSRQQLELEFGDSFGQPMTAAAESPTTGSLPHFSTLRPAVGQQNTLRSTGSA
jgi:Phage integrase family